MFPPGIKIASQWMENGSEDVANPFIKIILKYVLQVAAAECREGVEQNNPEDSSFFQKHFSNIP